MSQVLEFLKAEGILSEVSMGVLLNYMNRYQKNPFLAVLDCHVLDEGLLADVISKRMAIDRIYNLIDYRIDFDAMMKIPWNHAVKYNCVAVSYGSGKTSLEVVFSDPTSKSVIENTQALFNYRIIPVVAETSAIRSVVSKCYPIDVQLGLSPLGG
jgi:hypothetical protein